MKLGERIVIKDCGESEEYVLVMCASNKVLFVSVKRGLRWQDGMQVANPFHVTSEELKELLDYDIWYCNGVPASSVTFTLPNGKPIFNEEEEKNNV